MSFPENSDIKGWIKKYERLRSIVAEELGVDSAIETLQAQVEQLQRDLALKGAEWREAVKVGNDALRELAQVKADRNNLVESSKKTNRMLKAALAYTLEDQGI